MLVTLGDIATNTYVNHFEEIAKSFGLEGLYVRYHFSPTRQDEIFFVCGTDRDVVRADDINIESILSNQQKRYALHNTGIAVFKISGNDPLLTHRDVVEYCQTTEFLRNLYRDNNIPLPEMVPHGIISGLKMAYQNANNPSISQEVRKTYLDDIKKALKTQEDLYTYHGNDQKKVDYFLYQQYDTQKSKLGNLINRLFNPDKNKVSMKHLLVSCKEIMTVGVHITDQVKVQEELRKRSDILYWMADKPIGQKIQCPDNQGYGSQKANDQRYIAFSFDSEQCADFMAIVNKIEHPEAYQTTAGDLASNYSFVQHLSIHADDYDRYAAALSNRGIKYCIDDTSNDPGIINLVVASDFPDNVSHVLNRISSENEVKHLYINLEERQKNAPQDFMDAQKTKLEGDIIARAKSSIGFSDAELVSVSGDLLSNSVLDDDISI